MTQRRNRSDCRQQKQPPSPVWCLNQGADCLSCSSSVHKGDDAILFPAATWPASWHCLHTVPLPCQRLSRTCARNSLPSSRSPSLLPARLCVSTCACTRVPTLSPRDGFLSRVTGVLCCGEPCRLCVHINVKLGGGSGGRSVASSYRLPASQRVECSGLGVHLPSTALSPALTAALT